MCTAILAWGVAVLAIRYAEPIIDGDLFWHMKYAEQMLARGTLISDHTLYSWTPAANDKIYCAWLAELALYGLHQLGGLPALFALRYLCLGIVGALLLLHARSLGLLGHPLVWALVLLALLAVIAGTLIKPELLSLIAFSVVVFAYCRARLADQTGANAAGWFWAIPFVVLLWVNSHGGFILAAPFFAATFAGEMLARWFSPQRALARGSFNAMFGAWVASALAVLATPYGWRYPAELVTDYALRSEARPDEIWNAAYQSVFGTQGWPELQHYGLLLAAAAVMMLLLSGRRVFYADWGLALSAVFYLPLFVMFVRATPYLPVVVSYLALEVLAAPAPQASPTWRRLGMVAACLIAMAAGTRALYAARTSPSEGAWIGFGIGYVNPVAESEFLAASKLGPNLYNIFDSGGYLLWRLAPAYKVMTDSRSFPYLSWFNEQYAFAEGRSFSDFLAKYPADTAIIDLDRFGLWRNFLQSQEWRVAFYGPTAAVFVRRNVSDSQLARDIAPNRFDGIRNAQNALDVFNFAVLIDDYSVAWNVLGQLEGALRHQIDPVRLARATALRDGHLRLKAGEFDAARRLFELSSARPIQGWREAVILRLLRDLATVPTNERERIEAALRDLALP